MELNPLSNCGIAQSAPAPAELSIAAAYNELRRIARCHLRRQLPGLTLEPTALVHEAWLKLQKSDAAGVWKDRRHLCSTVAAVMWQILIDRGRRLRTERHGGHLSRAEKDLQQIVACCDSAKCDSAQSAGRCPASQILGPCRPVAARAAGTSAGQRQVRSSVSPSRMVQHFENIDSFRD